MQGRFDENLNEFLKIYESIWKQQPEIQFSLFQNIAELRDIVNKRPIADDFFNVMSSELDNRLDASVTTQTSERLFDDIQYAQVLWESLQRLNHDMRTAPPLPPPEREEEATPMTFPVDIPRDVVHTLIFTNDLVMQLIKAKVLGIAAERYYKLLYRDIVTVSPIHHDIFRHLTVELQEAMIELIRGVPDDASTELKANKTFLLTLLSILWTQTIELYTKLSVIRQVSEETVSGPPVPKRDDEPEEEEQNAPPPPPPPPPSESSPPNPLAKVVKKVVVRPEPKPENPREAVLKEVAVGQSKLKPTPQTEKVVVQGPDTRGISPEMLAKGGSGLKKTGGPEPRPKYDESAALGKDPTVDEALAKLARRRAGITGSDDEESESDWEDDEAQIPLILEHVMRRNITRKMEAQLIGHPIFAKRTHSTLVLRLRRK